MAKTVINVDRERAVRRYHITRPRDGALLAQARAQLVWQDAATGQPVRAPQSLPADLSPQVSAGPSQTNG